MLFSNLEVVMSLSACAARTERRTLLVRGSAAHNADLPKLLQSFTTTLTVAAERLGLRLRIDHPVLTPRISF